MRDADRLVRRVLRHGRIPVEVAREGLRDRMCWIRGATKDSPDPGEQVVSKTEERCGGTDGRLRVQGAGKTALSALVGP